MVINSALRQILALARWAPSGDNTQPWRFKIVGEWAIEIHGFDTRDHILYDYLGHASHMAHGALLETMRIAATGHGCAMNWDVVSDSDCRRPIYRVRFAPSDLPEDKLFPFIEQRVVQRRPMHTTRLGGSRAAALSQAAGSDFGVKILESWSQRVAVAKLLWHNAYLRLTCPEAYPVHREIIEWGARFSKDRIPEQAVGVDPLTAKLMAWVMQDWERVVFFNRYLLGTVFPRIQLDVFPALGCAAHVLLMPKREPNCLEDWLALGQAMQRVWLTASSLGLYLQPEMTPVIFRWYVQGQIQFSQEKSLYHKAEALAARFERLVGAEPSDPFGFFCRVGESNAPLSRSTRQDLDFLLIQ